MDSKKRAIVIGALLHDIGKVGQRAQKKNELSQETLDRETEICPRDPKDNFSTHLHVLWTDEFFSKYFTDDLRDNVIGEVAFDFNPQNLASFHHKSHSPLQKIIQIADRTSSGERPESERGDKDDYIKRRLSAIFNKVALKGEPEITEPYFYNLTQLDLKKDVFPKKRSELDPPYGTQEIEKYKEKYRELWEGLKKGFEQLRDKTIESNLDFDVFLNGLYHLLMKYMWCVPSYTNAVNEEGNDISLFDHSRTTAAIASCLFDYYRDNELPENTSEKEFLVVEGDISGIQKFLYMLSQPSNVKGVGKILRGRSMFLTLLPIVAANHITRNLNQTFINILYAGGGNFQIILPNTDDIKKELKKAVDEIDSWLFKEFRGELGLVVGYVEANRDNLGKGYGEVIHRLKMEMENQKSKKFLRRLFEENKFKIEQKDKVCSVCGSLDAATEEDLCDMCADHRNLGSEIPKANYIAFTNGNSDSQKGIEIDLGILGRVRFLREPLKDSELKDLYSYWKINSTESDLGFKFLGRTVPKATQVITKDELSGREIENEQYKVGEVISFDHLDLLADGNKKLGALRMDVDYLGLVFSIGLSEVVEDKEGKWKTLGLSISRAAMLSRMLDWFFTGYLNTLCDTLSNELRDKPSEGRVKNLRSKIHPHYYIVYSGGDDLFVVAPWDEVAELALQIRNDLKEFACYNPDIDISGGLSLTGAKFPVSRSGEIAGEELDGRAKKKRRSFAAFGETDNWDGVEKSLEFGRVLEQAIKGVNGKKLPRTFLNRVLEIRRSFEGLKEDDPRRFLHKPELVYSLTRNVDDNLKVNRRGKDIWIKQELWSELIESNTGLEKAGFGIKYALIKTRRR